MASTPVSTSSNEDFSGSEVLCSIGQTTNLMYSRNMEQSRPFRENMHRKFAYPLQEDHFVYGVLTGFEDISAVKFYSSVLEMVISQHIQKPANSKLVLNSPQLDQFYTKLLVDAFLVTEEQFLQHKSEKLSERTMLSIDLNGSQPEEYPTVNDRMKQLERELSSGLSAVVALVHAGRIYVANIGDTRAILCKKVFGDGGQEYIHSVAICSTHDLENANELRRLSQLGIQVEVLQQHNRVGNMNLTRCLGNLYLKNFYTDFADLSKATGDPILAEPEVTAIAIDQNCQFLILSSASLIEALREATGKLDVTDDLVRMVNEQFEKHTDLESISQEVISQICQNHQTCFASTTSLSQPSCRQIEDITLVVRDLRNCNSSTAVTTPESDLGKQFVQLSISVDGSEHSDDSQSPSLHHHTRVDNDKTIIERTGLGASFSQTNLLEDNSQPNDEEDEIDAYVDFTDLLKAYHEPLPVQSSH